MYGKPIDSIGFVSSYDPEVAAMMSKELDRQEYGIELIASENFVSHCNNGKNGEKIHINIKQTEES